MAGSFWHTSMLLHMAQTQQLQQQQQQQQLTSQ
jgi:hypothetical protein